MANTETPGYGAVAKILHWAIFFLLAAQYAIGSIMPHIGRKTVDEGWVAWHFSVGAAILFFIVIRLLWRLWKPVPLLPTDAGGEASFRHHALGTLSAGASDDLARLGRSKLARMGRQAVRPCHSAVGRA
jgi:cytochrome b561